MSEPLTSYQEGYLQALIDWSWRSSGDVFVGSCLYPTAYQTAVNRFLGPGHTVTFSHTTPEGDPPGGDPESALPANKAKA